MAAMTAQQREDCIGQWMRDYEPTESFTITKPDLRAALNAIDDWVVANASAFNTAIPLPARTSLTTRQKARMLAAVIRWRFDVGA